MILVRTQTAGNNGDLFIFRRTKSKLNALSSHSCPLAMRTVTSSTYNWGIIRVVDVKTQFGISFYKNLEEPFNIPISESSCPFEHQDTTRFQSTSSSKSYTLLKCGVLLVTKCYGIYIGHLCDVLHPNWSPTVSVWNMVAPRCRMGKGFKGMIMWNGYSRLS